MRAPKVPRYSFLGKDDGAPSMYPPCGIKFRSQHFHFWVKCRAFGIQDILLEQSTRITGLGVSVRILVWIKYLRNHVPRVGLIGSVERRGQSIMGP